MPINDLFLGFSKLTVLERFERLLEMGALTQEDILYLQSGGINEIKTADYLIENAIGYFQIPLGVATNFYIDGEPYVIPMAVEETSIIAALSKTAKWIRDQGEIKTSTQGDCIIGQIQIAKVKNFNKLERAIEENKNSLILKVNSTIAAAMVKRGGGVKDIYVRSISYPNGEIMGVLHLTMNPVDAMGANIINQILESLREPIQELTGETVSMCILTNLNDSKLTIAQVTINNVEEELGRRIEQASIFAELDPYRAATHNKGVLNGIDPVLIATGNDWRAVDAGIHSYAVKNGQYRSITTWRYSEGVLHGELIAPIVVGTVGGVTSIHPTAIISLKMLGVKSANELSRIIAAVGLVQNLGALRALCTEGITQGHMKLHLTNLMIKAGAIDSEFNLLKEILIKSLKVNKCINYSTVLFLLNEFRKEQENNDKS